MRTYCVRAKAAALLKVPFLYATAVPLAWTDVGVARIAPQDPPPRPQTRRRGALSGPDNRPAD